MPPLTAERGAPGWQRETPLGFWWPLTFLSRGCKQSNPGVNELWHGCLGARVFLRNGIKLGCQLFSQEPGKNFFGANRKESLFYSFFGVKFYPSEIVKKKTTVGRADIISSLLQNENGLSICLGALG